MGALAVDHNQGVDVCGGRREVVVTAVCCVEEALAGVAGAAAQERAGDGTVAVVDDADGGARGGWLDIRPTAPLPPRFLTLPPFFSPPHVPPLPPSPPRRAPP